MDTLIKQTGWSTCGKQKYSCSGWGPKSSEWIPQRPGLSQNTWCLNWNEFNNLGQAKDGKKIILHLFLNIINLGSKLRNWKCWLSLTSPVLSFFSGFKHYNSRKWGWPWQTRASLFFEVGSYIWAIFFPGKWSTQAFRRGAHYWLSYMSS